MPAWGSFGRLTESRTSAGNLSVVEHNSAAPVFYAVNPTLTISQPLMDIGTSDPVVRALPMSSHLEIECLKSDLPHLLSDSPFPFRPPASEI